MTAVPVPPRDSAVAEKSDIMKTSAMLIQRAGLGRFI
jgi:hypothetical protein